MVARQIIPALPNQPVQFIRRSAAEIVNRLADAVSQAQAGGKRAQMRDRETLMKQLLLAFALLAACSTGPQGGSDPTMAKVESGALHGVAADGIVAFKGVPYAAAPVGDLR